MMTLTKQEATRADAAFGTSLYRTLSPRGNTVFSPASIAAALKMTLAGARGETADELAAALHLGASADGAASLSELAALGAASTGDDLTLRTPNTMWLDETLTVRETYLRTLAGSVGVERCDFRGAPDASRQAINAWVEQQTAGKITNLVSRQLISAATRLVLVNAVYLNALWERKFPADNTDQQPFYAERLEPSVTSTMHLETDLAYHRGDGYQSVLLPYRGGTLGMAIVLPDGPLSEFAPGFDVAAAVGTLVADGTKCRVRLSLPRFRVEASFLLADVLRALGVRRAFTNDADFSGICDEPVAISEVVHKAFIDVGEEGTEAAAATAVVVRAAGIIRRPEPDVIMTVDRPFLFAIADTRTGLPLFLGQYTGPPR
ncbi:MAG TPA: serpin family protein [Trebonia sp.]|jgi:serpin B